MSGYRLAVCAEMVFLDLPFDERVRRIADLGFEVEMWDWTAKDIDALAKTGATFSSMTGYIGGTLADSDGADELLRTAQLSLDVAEPPRLPPAQRPRHRPGRPRAARGPRRDGDADDVADRRPHPDPARRTRRARRPSVHPGEPEHRRRPPRHPVRTAADTMALVEAVGSPYLRMNLDLYHAQIGEGNLIQLLERALPLIGEIQVADVPGRQEPGTGEINYPAIAAALSRLDYQGVIGLEGWASTDPEQALDRFRNAFAG